MLETLRKAITIAALLIAVAPAAHAQATQTTQTDVFIDRTKQMAATPKMTERERLERRLKILGYQPQQLKAQQMPLQD